MTKAMRALLTTIVGALATAAVVIAQAAPTLGDASLTVDQQVHLGADSHFFKSGDLLLWEDGDNTGLGKNALASNSSGFANAAFGTSALLFNTIGVFNTAVGRSALKLNENGERNTAVGGNALTSNVSGSLNTAVGLAAMESNNDGSSNTAMGSNALAYNTSGSYNTAVGDAALNHNEDGVQNTAVGYGALANNTTGNRNTAVGRGALLSSNASNNSAVGRYALFFTSSGSSNTGLGAYASFYNTEGDENTAIGENALAFNQTGFLNVAVGNRAGYNLGYVDPQTGASTYSHNIFIGNHGEIPDQNLIRIGTVFADQGDADPTNDTGQNKTFIAGIATATGETFLVDVCIDPATDQLGPCPPPPPPGSSRRFKQEIQDIGRVSEKLMQLRPVRFRFKEEHARGDRSVQYGLIAEEVAEVFPELAIYDDDGAPRSVKYHLLSSLLLNELQKQASAMKAQAERLAELEDVKARLVRLEALQTRPPRVATVADRARISPELGRQ